jgi:hypothetical protein
MPDPLSDPKFAASLGLCADCVHARIISSAKGSTFLLCQLSQSDPHFMKYPRLPVIRCSGYTPKPSDDSSS